MEPNTPHNALFLPVFSRKENAVRALCAALRPELAERIDWGTLCLQVGHDVDEELRESQSDRLYHARLLPAHFARLRLGLRCVLKTKKRVPRAPRPNARLTNAQIAPRPNARLTNAQIAGVRSIFEVKLSGQTVGLYVLFEHQSTVSWLVPFRLIRYIVRIGDKCLAQHAGAKRVPGAPPVVLSCFEGLVRPQGAVPVLGFIFCLRPVMCPPPCRAACPFVTLLFS
ncbi:MAG: Rpn family recombination-promoting nuclease/putative transposase [Polyangiaceae bacterium]|nr:Rpn family recombination-promoting nuclease/putative transposase [Polyangiaceae bacterium]